MMAGAVAPPTGAGVKDAPPDGRAVFVMATVVVVEQRALALSMAYPFRSGYPHQCTVLAPCSSCAPPALWRCRGTLRMRSSCAS